MVMTTTNDSEVIMPLHPGYRKVSQPGAGGCPQHPGSLCMAKWCKAFLECQIPKSPWLSLLNRLIWMISGCFHFRTPPYMLYMNRNWDIPATTTPASWMVFGLFRLLQTHVFRTDSVAATLHICSRKKMSPFQEKPLNVPSGKLI